MTGLIDEPGWRSEVVPLTAPSMRAEIVGAADHGQDLAVSGSSATSGGVAHVVSARRAVRPAVALGQALQPVAHDVAGGLVQVEVQGGVDAQPALLQPVQAQLLLQLVAHVHHKVGRADGKSRPTAK